MNNNQILEKIIEFVDNGDIVFPTSQTRSEYDTLIRIFKNNRDKEIERVKKDYEVFSLS